MRDALEALSEDSLARGQETRELDAVQLGPPVPSPGKIIGVGLNYRDHAKEADMELPAVPLLFAKFSSAVTGPGSPVRLPVGAQQVDYEAELAVVIGAQVTNVDASQALNCVAGYTIMNDISARDLQFGEGSQWTRSKSLDTFAPMGPFLRTRDEIPDPQDLDVRCELNGERVQDSNTRHMVFPVAELIAFISRGMTLMPGDVIATGTPAGVGMASDPPRWLVQGDQLAVTIDGLGCLENQIERLTG
jgi:2-keto-4-pentenoate hydratase/2-oxohepta-3-ene-1,7-dioic acid hydratase in catechol pathway